MRLRDLVRPLFRWRWKVYARLNKWWDRNRTPIARIWRNFLPRTTFIAVCGSAGKTTTKELLGTVLAEHCSTKRTSGTWGGLKAGGVPGTILSVRPWHKYAVVEAAIEYKGQMQKMANLIKPDIVIMLGVKECHIMEFKTIEGVAAEKAEMLKALRPTGIAVLNGDDPLVCNMESVGTFRSVKFGVVEQEISACNIHSRWPDRLNFTLSVDGESHAVRSKLVGKHWVNAVLATIAAARECGVSPQKAIATIERIEPFWARMQPITLDNRVTYLRDEFNGSYDTFVEAIQVLREASDVRKIAVVAEYSDSHKSSKSRVRVKRLSRELAAVVDVLIFVGERSDYGQKAALDAGLSEDCSFSAYDVREASEILKTVQKPGDLVLIKGRTSEHLSRVYLDQLASVSCEREHCPRQHICDRCPELGFQWEEKYSGLMAPMEVRV